MEMLDTTLDFDMVIVFSFVSVVNVLIFGYIVFSLAEILLKNLFLSSVSCQGVFLAYLVVPSLARNLSDNRVIVKNCVLSTY